MKLGWRKINGDFFVREIKEGIAEGGTNAIFAFLDSLIGHADNIEGGKPTTTVAFNFD